MEKFDNEEEAVKRAEQIGGIVIRYSISKMVNGKYEVDIYIYEAFDGLTRNVFVNTEDNSNLRRVNTKNENTYYEDMEDTTSRMQIMCDSFVDAKEKLKEIIEKIMEDRKKIRMSTKEYGYIVF
jgi:uncharacterized protein YlzI (FlbEa/FlbD family)